MPRPRWLITIASGLVAIAASTPLAQQPSATAALDQFLAKELLARPADIARIHEGRPYVTPLASTVTREVIVVGVVKIAAPAEQTVAVIRDIEKFEGGAGFLQTKRLSDPPTLNDFAAYQVDTDDLESLRECQPGACDVKLSREAFPLLKTINWSAPDVRNRVSALARQIALDYLLAYRRGGNAELAVYADAERPTFVQKEFEEMVQRASELPSRLPQLMQFLLEYPKVANRAAFEDFTYWSVADFGLKPVFRLNHVVIHKVPQPAPVRFAIATKQLYANHYFHTALEVRALIDAAPDAKAHYMVVLNMGRSDGLTGLFGGLVKSKAQAGARDGIVKALNATREAVERR